MNCALILNGTARNAETQIEDLGCFLTSNHGVPTPAEVIAFYSNATERERILARPIGERLRLVRVPAYDPEIVLDTLAKNDTQYDMYLFSGETSGRECAVRLSARAGGSALVAVDTVRVTDAVVACGKAVYSGYAHATFELTMRPICLSIARTGKTAPDRDQAPYVHIEEDTAGVDSLPGYVLERSMETVPAAGTLDQSRFILAGGNAVKSKKETEELQRSAEALGADFAVSRPPAMSAFAPLRKLIGVSGALVSPDVCIAAGISGAPAFFAGIENSGFIAAINTDPNAPIVGKSDVAVIDDYRPVVKELVRLAKEDRCGTEQ